MFDYIFKNNVWWFGIAGFSFGIVDRLYNLSTDGWYSAVDLAQLFTVAVFVLAWFILKPDGNENAK